MISFFNSKNKQFKSFKNSPSFRKTTNKYPIPVSSKTPNQQQQHRYKTITKHINHFTFRRPRDDLNSAPHSEVVFFSMKAVCFEKLVNIVIFSRTTSIFPYRVLCKRTHKLREEAARRGRVALRILHSGKFGQRTRLGAFRAECCGAWTRPTSCFWNRNGLMVYIMVRWTGNGEGRDKRSFWGFVLLLVRWRRKMDGCKRSFGALLHGAFLWCTRESGNFW